MPGSEVTIEVDGGYIAVDYVEFVTRTSVKFEDCVVSVPPEGYKKIFNMYYNPKTGGLVITCEKQE